jgi:hypothetical protein
MQKFPLSYRSNGQIVFIRRQAKSVFQANNFLCVKPAQSKCPPTVSMLTGWSVSGRRTDAAVDYPNAHLISIQKDWESREKKLKTYRRGTVAYPLNRRAPSS